MPEFSGKIPNPKTLPKKSINGLITTLFSDAVANIARTTNDNVSIRTCACD